MSVTLDSKLDVLKNIVDSQQRKEEISDYKKHGEMYDLVKDAIRNKGLVLYGGYALNALMPKSHRIYKDKTLPDLDAFSTSAKKDAIEIGLELKKAGYSYIEVKSGVHKGTYKVFAEFKPVADITQVSKALFSYLSSNSKEVSSMKVCPPEFLMWSLYKELCRPQGSGFRWEKIYARYLVFHRQFRFKEKALSIKDTSPSTVPEVIKKMSEVAKKKAYAVVGHFAVKLHTGKPCKILKSMPDFEFIVENIDEAFQQIQADLGVELGFKKNPTNSFYEVMSYSASITYNGMNLCRLYQTDSCYSYQQTNGYRVGTVDTVLHFLYGTYMTSSHFNTSNGLLADASKRLIIALEEHAQKELSDPKQRLKVKCVGYEKTILNVKKELWTKKPFNYRP